MGTRANGVLQTPANSYQFTVRTIPNTDGMDFLPDTQIGFTRVSGLSDKTEVVKYKEGNDLYQDQVPGMTEAAMVTLMRGLDLNNFLLKWRNAVKERTALPGKSYRCDVIITIWRRQGAPGAAEVPTEKVAVWKLKQAWPCELKMADLDANSSEINIQELQLACYGPPEQIFPAFDA